MNTTRTTTFSDVKSKKTTKSTLWENMEFNRYGLNAIQLLIIGCLGGIAAAAVLPVSLIGLALLGLAAVVSLTSMLAVMPMKWVVGSGVIAVLLDLTVLLVVLL